MLLGAIAASRFIFGNNPNPGPSAILDSAFAWYRLDDVEPSGILFDSSSNAAHGTYSSTVAPAGAGISRAESCWKARGRTRNGAFFPNAAAWQAGANDPNGWIVSVFLRRDPTLTLSSYWESIACLGNVSGTYAGLSPTTWRQFVWSPTSSMIPQASRPQFTMGDTDFVLGRHMYTFAYRRNYLAEGRNKFAGYIDGVRVPVTNANASLSVNCGSSGIRGGQPANYESTHGNAYDMNDLISAPNPYTTDAAEEAAILELYNALR